jgi:hypothetical protein
VKCREMDQEDALIDPISSLLPLKSKRNLTSISN